MTVISMSVLLKGCHAQLKTYTENISYDTVCVGKERFSVIHKYVITYACQTNSRRIPTNCRAEADSAGLPTPLQLTAHTYKGKVGLQQQTCRTFHSFNLNCGQQVCLEKLATSKSCFVFRTRYCCGKLVLART